MSLRPSNTVQKVLISTTSRLVGEYESDDICIAHAWPAFHDPFMRLKFAEGGTSRSAYVVAFETPAPHARPGSALPDYTPTGDAVCSYLAVLFGTRFANH